MSETALEHLLFPPPPPQGSVRRMPDYAAIHRELQARKNVTLHLLWQEYKEQQPDGYQYSWFVSTTASGQSSGCGDAA